jgi:hypothetical protein
MAPPITVSASPISILYSSDQILLCGGNTGGDPNSISFGRKAILQMSQPTWIHP